MKVSLNIVRSLAGIEKDIASIGKDELTRLATNRLGGLEAVVDYGRRFDGVIVAKVMSCVDHDNSDHLHVCMIDDGGVAKDVERDKDGYVQVVCGAPNVREGLIVAWIPPGATVPASLDEAEPFVLSKREIRGMLSNGMLASPKELGLFDSHDGILEISPGERGAEQAKPGEPFKNLYGLDDILFDFENKMFTHRPDCFGQIGVGRELAAITGQKFSSPEWYWKIPHFDMTKELPVLEISNEIDDLVPRIMAVTMKNIKVGESPTWLKAELSRLGSKPVNNVVDISNYVMHLTGQPTHAYDLSKLSGGTIGARFAKKGETIALLNGKTIELTADDMVIADSKRPVGVAGVMGGSETEVDTNTTDVLLEVASFDMYTIRRSAMRHGLFTDAFTRFSKGQSPLQNDRVLAKFVEMLEQVVGAELSSDVADVQSAAVRVMSETQTVHPSVLVSSEFINNRLGTSLSNEEIAGILRNVEMAVLEVDGDLEIAAPFWRTDIELKEDIVEEVGRLYGFDQLDLKLPLRTTKPAAKNQLNEFKTSLRNKLATSGANEVYSYSFLHGDLLKKTGLEDVDKWALHLRNALSPDLQYYRTSLLPSLLAKIHPNLKSDIVRSDDNEFVLFEIGKAHVKEHVDEEKLPTEFERLALVVAADEKTAARKYEGSAYYQAKKYLDVLLDEQAEYKALESNAYPITSPYQLGRSAMVYVDGELLGVIGEMRSSVRKALKLPDFCAGFELDLGLLKSKLNQRHYMPIGQFPKTQQDITLRANVGTSYEELRSIISEELHAAKQSHGYESALTPRDIYQKDGESSKNLTFRIWLWHPEKTLKTEEANALLDAIAQRAAKELGAVRI